MYVVPKWGLHMAAAMVAWALGHWLLYFIMARVSIPRIYLPLSTSDSPYSNGYGNGHANGRATELEPMLVEDAPPRRSSPVLERKPSSRRRCFSLWNIAYWSVFCGYCSLALFGWYLWETREPEDNLRWKRILDKSVSEPRKQGYAKGGT